MNAAAAIDVLFLIPPQVQLLDLAGPAEAFRLANERLAGLGHPPGFRLRYVGPMAEAASSPGLSLHRTETLPPQLEVPSWILLPASAMAGADGAAMPTLLASEAWQACAAWLQQHLRSALQRDRGHRLIAIGGGALLAAAAGLLDKRRCTTHTSALDALHHLAPQAEVVDNRLFLLDGPLASCAGSSAGLDLAVHLLALHCGDAVAAGVARALALYLRHGPHEPPPAPLLAHRNHLQPALHRLQDAICADPKADWSLQRMASFSKLTARHLSRLFAEHAGATPLHYLQGIRLDRARLALHRGATIADAAAEGGFRTDQQLRRAWARLRPGSPGGRH